MSRKYQFASAVLMALGLSIAAIFTVSESHAEGYGAHERTCSWGTNFDQPDRLDGIDTASVKLIRLIAGPEEGVMVAFWSNGSQGFSGTSGAKCYGPATSIGDVRGSSGEKLPVHAETQDGKTGWVRIGDTRYDLEKGALFLFDTKQETPRVTQVKVEMKQLGKGFGMLHLIEFARRNSEIKKFWAESDLPYHSSRRD